MNCIHLNKTKCTYCSEILNKSIQFFTNDWYQAKSVGEQGTLEKYLGLKAWTESKRSFERSLT